MEPRLKLKQKKTHLMLNLKLNT